MLSLPPPFSSERDGPLWAETMLETREGTILWLRRLVGAELAGWVGYRQMIPVLPDWARVHASRIARQEDRRYSMALRSLKRLGDYEPILMPHEATIQELDSNERRSLMRLETLLTTGTEYAKLAIDLIADEAYHCWFMAKLMQEVGPDWAIPRIGWQGGRVFSLCATDSWPGRPVGVCDDDDMPRWEFSDTQEGTSVA